MTLSTPITASVIICSRNRVNSLVETLDRLVAMVVPADIVWEILVVDNASTDGTANRVREWSLTSDTPVVVIEEPRPGKAYALNRAVSQARGEFLLFTDDDALVDAAWLTTTLAAFATSGAECVGGRVLPHWLAPRPAWLTDRLINVLAMLDLGPEPRELTAADQGLVYGVNYAFRRHVFTEIGVFDTALCARGCGNEDYEFIGRLRSAGGRVFYDPRILVGHKVFPERLTRAYFRRWHHLWGRDRAETVSRTGRSILGLEMYMVRGALATLGRLVSAAVRLDAEGLFYQELRSRLYLAYLQRRLAQRLAGTVPQPRPVAPRLGGQSS